MLKLVMVFGGNAPKTVVREDSGLGGLSALKLQVSLTQGALHPSPLLSVGIYRGTRFNWERLGGGELLGIKRVEVEPCI